MDAQTQINESFNALQFEISNYSEINQIGTYYASDCSWSCSGDCSGGCTGCTGCSGSCQGNCSGSCSGYSN